MLLSFLGKGHYTLMQKIGIGRQLCCGLSETAVKQTDTIPALKELS